MKTSRLLSPGESSPAENFNNLTISAFAESRRLAQPFYQTMRTLLPPLPESMSHAGSLRTWLSFLFVTMALCLSLSTAKATSVTWDGDSGTNLFWATPGNWDLGTVPTSSDAVYFTATGAAASGVTSSVTDNYTIQSLNFTAYTTGEAQHLEIADGKTLTLASPSGSTILGVGLYAAAATSSGITKAVFSGDGTLTVNGSTTKNILVANTGAGAYTAEAVLDLSGLANFNATVGTFAIGTGTGLNSTSSFIRGRTLLAQNSTITATSIVVGSGGSNSNYNQGYLELGQSTVLNVDALSVGLQKSNGYMYFQEGTYGASLQLRGRSGGSTRATINVGQYGSSGSPQVYGEIDWRGGNVDAMVSDLNVGYGSSTGGGNTYGYFKYSSGTIDATTVSVALQSGAVAAPTTTPLPSPTAALYGVAKVGGDAQMTVGTLKIGTNSTTATSYKNVNALFWMDGGSVTVDTALTIAYTPDGSLGTSTGELRLTGGSLTVNAANGIQAGALTTNTQSNSILTVDGGHLNMTGKAIGSATSKIKTLNFYSGELKNIGEINGGDALVKTTGGVLLMSGTNTYTGGTTINGGLVSFVSDAALPDTGTVTVNSGGAVAFGYSNNVQAILNSGIVSHASTGSIALTSSQSGQNIDFSQATGANMAAYLGAYGNVTYTGTYTPYTAGVYRLGGGTGTLTYGANISGSDSVIIGGSTGTVILSGNNTYTGGTTINVGTLKLTNIDDIGASNNALTFNGGTLAWGSGVSSDISSGRTVTFNSGGATFDTAGNNVTFASAVGNGGSGGLTKTGNGTLTLQALNTYTGATTVNGGTLKLDLATNNTGVINSSSALVLGGGILNVQGKSSGTSSQTLGNVTLSAASASKIVLNPSTGSGTTLTLGNTWTRNAGSTLHIDLSAGGIVSSQPIASVSSQGEQSNLLGYTTIQDGSGIGFGIVVNNALVRYTAAKIISASGDNLGGNYNMMFVGNGSTITLGSSAASVGTMQFNTSANSGTLDLNGKSISVTRQAILMTGSHDYTITNGILGAPSTELIVQQYGAGILDIASAVASYPGVRESGGTNVTVSTGSLTKAGTGTLRLSGDSTYTGATTVTGGTLLLDGSITSNVTVNQGATLGGIGTTSESIIASAGSFLAPGTTSSAKGTLTADNLTWNGGATFQFNLSTTDNTSDRIDLTGVFVMGLDGAYTFDFLGGGYDGGVYTLLNFNGHTFTSASQFSYTNLGAGLNGEFSISNDSLVFTVIPEPQTWALLIGGSLVAFMARRRFRRLA